MPYVSDAQRKYFHANEGKKGITSKMVKEYDRASKGRNLPKRIKERPAMADRSSSRGYR
jgi:hypothetical protein